MAKGPRIMQPEPGKAVRRVGFGIDPFNPYPALELCPEQLREVRNAPRIKVL